MISITIAGVNNKVKSETTLGSDSTAAAGSTAQPDSFRCADALECLVEHVLTHEGGRNPALLATRLVENLRARGLPLPPISSTPYVNTIPVQREPEYPGNRELERRIKSLIRWNAMAMVVAATRAEPGSGGQSAS